MREASKEYGYGLDFAEIAKIWRGGCIIRARVLEGMRAAFSRDAELVNLMTAPEFAPTVNDLGASLRAACATAIACGVPALGMCASLGYIDSYRAERLPQNLLQGQRDYFGAHKYERIDKPRGEQFHTEWIG
jgi:6-phosphogluconate dehydrogenase